MNHTKRWLWLVLISSVQLIVLLVTVLCLFNWQNKSTTRALDQQNWNDNLSLIEQISSEIQIQTARNPSLNSADAVDRLVANICTGFSNAQCFVGLIDRGQNRFIKQLTPKREIDLNALLSTPVHSFENDEPLGQISSLLNSSKRAVSGWQIHDGQRLIVSAKLFPRFNLTAVVAQLPSPAKTQIVQVIRSSGATAFAITLVIGLVAIGITSIFIGRINETVQGLNGDLEKVVSDSTRELIRTKNAVIFGLAKLAESRDNDTGDHLERIRIYVTILAKELSRTCAEFDERLIHDLGLASSLHDIGKVGIPDSILLKPGKLTAEERGIMEIHTLIGGECLDAIQARLGDNEFMSIARQIAYYHHERWDGTGYPHSLKGHEIPLVARIVSVADVYDALTSKRPYKRAMTHAESRDIIVSGSGKHFDPEIVQAFLEHEDEFEAVSVHQQGLTDEQATSNFQRLCEAARAEAEAEKRSLSIAVG
jgi:HD-GYP domain-containing protein (c-di-GMP phosphodiesterase class II)